MRNPVGERDSDTERQALVPRVDDLEGKRIGLYKNSKPAAEPVTTVVRERLADRHPGATFVEYHRPARSEDSLREIGEWAAAEADACIAAVSDCGGCTRATVRATNAIEERSVPAVGLVAEGFRASWEANADDQGRPLRYQVLPIQSETTDVDVVRERVTTDAVDDIEAALTEPLTAEETAADD